ncbi:hypothetical protein A4X13_0g4781 [Tilletia indica]|uniref:SnoaL-like domain-containing protein n=1 Tax=Tilletia indica TaxID=43049 RepID=A0A8T8SXX0_9BASI|nr:hypothetical protein A4X13_0g4781 [Tilletia indica]
MGEAPPESISIHPAPNQSILTSQDYVRRRQSPHAGVRNFATASKYLTRTFISHHGQHKTEGVEAFVVGFQYALENFVPDFKMTIKKSVADQEAVWVWSEISGSKSGGTKQYVDIFDIDPASGKLKEKWDVQQ